MRASQPLQTESVGPFSLLLDSLHTIQRTDYLPMFINFRTFRKIILGMVLLVSVTSLVLSVYLRPSFTHPNSTYVLVGILDTLIFAATISMSRKVLFSPQTVATEVLGSFTLLPFALILTLYSLSLSVTPDPTTNGIFAVLQILIFIGTIIHGFYTIGLICIAMLTVCAFDRDVWSRDIDSSPSPFPMTVLFLFLFPCFSRPDPSPFPTADAHDAVICLPGCNCSTAKTQIPNTEAGMLEATPNMLMASGLSSRSLVRVPNDFERRNLIVIAFVEV
ncbi:hypothetical protein B0H17DRAFT_1064500 [Mycena rosella]|uniref:Uncharacterized protein n=1 Tax=Mycena rosella TaxID=1033263 RepID=A0AAD7GEG4_MYCRO|nr:hypothetical protein B0H17DRAFT_1064500 [Mycena rosella]